MSNKQISSSLKDINSEEPFIKNKTEGGSNEQIKREGCPILRGAGAQSGLTHTLASVASLCVSIALIVFVLIKFGLVLLPADSKTPSAHFENVNLAIRLLSEFQAQGLVHDPLPSASYPRFGYSKYEVEESHVDIPSNGTHGGQTERDI